MLATGHGWGITLLDGTLAASTLVLPYQTFAWISMVLVLPEHRRKGTHLLRVALADLRNRALTPILDATPAGREVYRQEGFRDTWTFKRLQKKGVRTLFRKKGRTPSRRGRRSFGSTASLRREPRAAAAQPSDSIAARCLFHRRWLRPRPGRKEALQLDLSSPATRTLPSAFFAGAARDRGAALRRCGGPRAAAAGVADEAGLRLPATVYPHGAWLRARARKRAARLSCGRT